MSKHSQSRALVDADILIRNLRLLDLDEEFDWPHIKRETFAASDSIRNQRSRVRAAEWILYKLFEIWEPQETKNNLQPFFPASEPKQSTHLKAALFKRLSELKKDGLFGKDVTIRKTMFDDCKGPKFEELLVMFSSCTLHKAMAMSVKDKSIAKQILEGACSDEKLYNQLTLAYDASLSQHLSEREVLERRWHKFGRVLRSKKEELDQRAHSIDQAVSLRQDKRIPKRTIDRLRKHVDTNWTGDTEWVDILMRSDRTRNQKTLLQRPFEEVWTHACNDTLYVVRPEKNESLLQELEGRVEQQNSRLERWKSIHDGLLSCAQTTLEETKALAVHTQNTSTLQVDMARSPALSFPETRAREASGSDWTDVDTEGDATSNRSSSHVSRISRQGTHSRSGSGIYQFTLPSSPRKSSTLSRNSTSPAKHDSSSSTQLDQGQKPDYFSSTVLRNPSVRPETTYQLSLEAFSRHKPMVSSEKATPSPPTTDDADHSLETLDDESTLAAQILSSVMNAEPSPLKPIPSLAERTRMSMAFMTPRRPSPPITPSDLRQSSPKKESSPGNVLHEAGTAIPDSRITLAERTRQSMSLMSAKPRNPQRRSSVQRASSSWSSNRSLSPEKAQGRFESANESVLEEALQNMGGDYESIFKSRPRIAVSPVLQPSSKSMEEIKEVVELDEEQKLPASEREHSFDHEPFKLANSLVSKFPFFGALLFVGILFVLAYPLRFSARLSGLFNNQVRPLVLKPVPFSFSSATTTSRPFATSVMPFKKPPQAPPLFTGTAESIVADTERLIKESRDMQDKLAKEIKPEAATFDNILLELAHDENTAALSSHILGFYQAVSEHQDLRDASTKADELLNSFSIESSMREDIYQLVDAVFQKKPQLESEPQRLLEKERKSFIRNGLNLPVGPKRDRFKEIKLRLSQLSIQFQKTLNEEKGGIWFTPEEMDGLPKDVLQDLQKGEGENAGKLRLTFKYPHLFPALKYITIPKTRKRIYIENENKCNGNVPLFKEAILLRDEAARLLGYPNHAAFRIEDKMAKTPKTVDDFLGDLRQRLTPLAKKEFEVLKAMKKHDLESSGKSSEDDGHYFTWDHRYYSRMQLENDYQVDYQKIAEFFPLETTLSGMLKIFEELLGLRFAEVTGEDRAAISSTGKGEDIVWHKDVQLFSVWNDESEGNGFVGYLYTDLHPREGKYGHAANFNMQPGFVAANGTRRYPATALVCNFSKPTPKKPSLLKHDEVVTLFHELGHGIHDLVGRTKFARFHGTSVVQDFVEAPSQMLENWCWTPSQLKALSHHYSSISPNYLATWKETAGSSGANPPPEKIPDDLVNSLIKAKHVNDAMANLRQLHFGIFDMTVHEPASHADLEALDPTILYNKLRAEIAILDGPEAVGMPWDWGHGQACFGHLIGGYDAGYYGYLSSQVYSMDMFYSVFEKDPMNGKEGRRYRHAVLEKGGSRDEMASLEDFLGRKPSSEAFYREMGL